VKMKLSLPDFNHQTWSKWHRSSVWRRCSTDRICECEYEPHPLANRDPNLTASIQTGVAWLVLYGQPRLVQSSAESADDDDKDVNSVAGTATTRTQDWA